MMADGVALLARARFVLARGRAGIGWRLAVAVAQLLLERQDAVDGLTDLVGLLTDVLAEAGETLLAIPGAAVGAAQVGHQPQHIRERRAGSLDFIRAAAHRFPPAPLDLRSRHREDVSTGWGDGPAQASGERGAGSLDSASSGVRRLMYAL